MVEIVKCGNRSVLKSANCCTANIEKVRGKREETEERGEERQGGREEGKGIRRGVIGGTN